MKFKANPARSSGESGVFLRLKSGESVRGVFRGNPHEYFARWSSKGYEPCGEDDDGASFRFRINFIMRNEDGTFTSRIWEQGARAYNELKDLAEDYDLEVTTVKIARSGEGKHDTKYSIVPLPKGEIKGTALKKIEAVQLLDLEPEQKHGADTSSEKQSMSEYDHEEVADDDVPF